METGFCVTLILGVASTPGPFTYDLLLEGAWCAMARDPRHTIDRLNWWTEPS